MNDIVNILREYNRDYELTKNDNMIGKKLREVFEENLLKSGRIEISNIQLSEITGKDIKNINRDMKEEFGEIFGRWQMDSENLDNNRENIHLLTEAVERITREIRVAEEPNSRNQLRPVYYFSGLALTQLISRWDTMIRLYVNMTVHAIQEKLEEQGYNPTSITEMNEDLKHVMDLSWFLSIEYGKLKSATKLEHVKKNYEDVMKQIEMKQYELQSLQRMRKEIYPSVNRITDELIEIDKNCADVMGKREKMETYKNKKDAKTAYERE